MGVLPPRQADGLVMGEAERAGIPFRRCGRVLLGLGDPSGEETDRVSAIWRLRDLAQQEGLDPAFWRAGPDVAEGVWRSRADRVAARARTDCRCRNRPTRRPRSPHYLVCMAERDLGTLLPLLPDLARKQDVAVPVAA